jgi:hypothetical protein
MCPSRAAVLLYFVVATSAIMAGCATAPPPLPISVSINSATQAIDPSQTLAINGYVTNDPSYQGVSWTLSGPGSLTASTSSSVTYTSPAVGLASPQQVTITATSLADQTKSASLQIALNPAPLIPFQTLSSGTVGTPYDQTIAFTGGTAPFHWGLYHGPIITGWTVGGTLPDGLKLDPAKGTISGIPTGGGTWYFEATLVDATGAGVAFGGLSIQINSNAAPGSPVPFLNQTLAPTAVSPGASGFTLSLTGAGFVTGATVNFNRAPLVTTFVDSQHLTATVPAANVSNAGTASMTVVNPGPGGGSSNVAYLQVGVPAATVSFANAPNSPLQIYDPLGLAVADLNEDGKPDLVVAANIRTFIFLGKGDGTFAQATDSPIEVPSPPYDDFGSPYVGPVAVADFNHSGHLGLAIGTVQNEAAAIFLGNGTGNFVPSSAAFANTFGMPTSALGPADFNGDGNLDLAITNQISGQSTVALGYGDGAFNLAGSLNTLGFAMGMAVGDFNADGKLDTVVVNGGTPAVPGAGVTVSLGNGDGTFTPPSGSPVPFGQNLSAIVSADFNVDGKLDVAVTDSGGNAVMILLGNGDGTFATPATIPVGNQPDAIVAADFNNDGKMDLAVANYADGTVTLLLGNGDGTFTQASGSPYAVGLNPYQIAAGDFNGDGKMDLAVANLGGTVSILLQQ